MQWKFHVQIDFDIDADDIAQVVFTLMQTIFLNWNYPRGRGFCLHQTVWISPILPIHAEGEALAYFNFGTFGSNEHSDISKPWSEARIIESPQTRCNNSSGRLWIFTALIKSKSPKNVLTEGWELFICIRTKEIHAFRQYSIHASIYCLSRHQWCYERFILGVSCIALWLQELFNSCTSSLLVCTTSTLTATDSEKWIRPLNKCATLFIIV